MSATDRLARCYRCGAKVIGRAPGMIHIIADLGKDGKIVGRLPVCAACHIDYEAWVEAGKRRGRK